MAGTTLLYRFIGIDAGAGAMFDRMSIKTAELGDSSSSAMGPVTAIGAAIATVGAIAAVAAYKLGKAGLEQATTYQSSLTRLVTGAGESAAGLAVVSKKLLQEAGPLSVGANDLAQAMYPIESAGFHGAAGVNILHAAVQGALADGANYTDVADAITTALVSYQQPAADAVGVTNEFVEAVAHGKTTMENLATSISTVIPTAAALHVPLNQVLGAMSTMTQEGQKATTSAQSLRYAIKSLIDPTGPAIAQLQQLGLHAGTLGRIINEQGLPAAFEKLTTAIGQKFPQGSSNYTRALANVVGGTRGLTSVLTLTGTHMDSFNQHVQDVTNGLEAGGTQVLGWGKYVGTLKYNTDAAKAGFQSLEIEIGEHLLPTATRVMHWLATDGIHDLDQFGHWFVANKQSIANFASETIKVFQYLFLALTTWAKDMLDMAADAFGWVPVIGGELKSARSHFDTFVNGTSGALSKFAGFLKSIGQTAGNNLGTGLLIGIDNSSVKVRAAVSRMTSAAVSEMNRGLGNHSPSVKAFQSGVWFAQGFINGWTGQAGNIKSALSTTMQDAINTLTTKLQDALTKQKNAFQAAQKNVQSVFGARSGAIGSLAGTISGQAGLSGLFGTDANGNPTTANVGTFLSAQVGPLKQFAQDLKWAANHHMSPVLLSQIANLGAVQGDQVLKQFMSGQASIAQANAAERQINAYSRGAASTAEDAVFARSIAKAEATDIKQYLALEAIRTDIHKIAEKAGKEIGGHYTLKVETDGKLKLTPDDGREIIKIIRRLDRTAGHKLI